jgi:[CysO sulfur-carrier protein]-S-L-cysteine hydrolase
MRCIENQKLFPLEKRKRQNQKFRKKTPSSTWLQKLNKRNIYIHPPVLAKRNPEHVAAAKSNRIRNDHIYIKKSVLNRMIDHCQQEAPYEACGLLSGIKGKNENLWKMKNMERTLTSFAMDVNQMAQVFKWMKQQGEEWTGIYHSHPTAAPYPSKSDIVNVHYPEVAYFIVSLSFGKPNVKCYRIKNSQVTPLKIIVLD